MISKNGGYLNKVLTVRIALILAFLNMRIDLNLNAEEPTCIKDLQDLFLRRCHRRSHDSCKRSQWRIKEGNRRRTNIGKGWLLEFHLSCLQWSSRKKSIRKLCSLWFGKKGVVWWRLEFMLVHFSRKQWSESWNTFHCLGLIRHVTISSSMG